MCISIFVQGCRLAMHPLIRIHRPKPTRHRVVVACSEVVEAEVGIELFAGERFVGETPKNSDSGGRFQRTGGERNDGARVFPSDSTLRHLGCFPSKNKVESLLKKAVFTER